MLDAARWLFGMLMATAVVTAIVGIYLLVTKAGWRADAAEVVARSVLGSQLVGGGIAALPVAMIGLLLAEAVESLRTIVFSVAPRGQERG